MSYWLLRLDAPSITMIERPPGFVIKSRGQPGIKPDDTIVLFTNIGGIATFRQRASVTAISSSAATEKDGYRETTVSVDEWTPLGDAIDLKTVLYSLTIVTNLERPMLHFRRGYRSLPRNDYETIVSGEVFVSRTFYYMLLHALPPTMQTAFRIQQMLEPPASRAGARFRETLGRLEQFISDRILSMGDMIVELNRTINRCELRDTSEQFPKHYICDAPEGAQSLGARADDISKQAETFDALRSSFGQFQGNTFDDGASVFGPIVSELSPNALPTESRFERIFLRAP